MNESVDEQLSITGEDGLSWFMWTRTHQSPGLHPENVVKEEYRLLELGETGYWGYWELYQEQTEEIGMFSLKNKFPRGISTFIESCVLGLLNT